MTRPGDDDALEAMNDMFNAVAAHREALAAERAGHDEVMSQLADTLPAVRKTIVEQDALIHKLIGYVNELHAELGRPPLDNPPGKV